MSNTMKEMLTTPEPKRCGEYSSGHEVHWIPAIKFSAEERYPATVSIGTGDSLVVHWIGPDLLYFNHDLERLRQICLIQGQRNISLNVKRSLLYIEHGVSGAYVFSLSTNEINPCSDR
jgi:hypothetical protein